jgi:hypothetical protein
MLSENVFVEVCSYQPMCIWKKIRSTSFQNAMRFFREFQESLTSYSKSHAYDKVQKAALEILHLLERKIRNPYFAEKRKSIMRTGLVLPEREIKRKIREDWEKFYLQISY